MKITWIERRCEQLWKIAICQTKKKFPFKLKTNISKRKKIIFIARESRRREMMSGAFKLEKPIILVNEIKQKLRVFEASAEENFLMVRVLWEKTNKKIEN